MILVPILLALCCRPSSAWDTYVEVNYTLTCPIERHQFTFTVNLMELDNFEETHDYITVFTHQAVGYYEGQISGIDDGDLSHNYEFALRIQHDCGGQKGEITRELPDCPTYRDRCDTFETQRFLLTPN